MHHCKKINFLCKYPGCQNKYSTKDFYIKHILKEDHVKNNENYMEAVPNENLEISSDRRKGSECKICKNGKLYFGLKKRRHLKKHRIEEELKHEIFKC
jgi:hypothetical protein